jgi:hypothetical protein
MTFHYSNAYTTFSILDHSTYAPSWRITSTQNGEQRLSSHPLYGCA